MQSMQNKQKKQKNNCKDNNCSKEKRSYKIQLEVFDSCVNQINITEQVINVQEKIKSEENQKVNLIISPKNICCLKGSFNVGQVGAKYSNILG